MPPRYAYWTIIAGGLPTAFRAADRDDLLPTFQRIKQKHPDAQMKWFARGKLWESQEAARAANVRGDRGRRPSGSMDRRNGPPGSTDRRSGRPGSTDHRSGPSGSTDRRSGPPGFTDRRSGPSGPPKERRGRDWRPGGDHRDPRQKFIDAKKARNAAVRKEKWHRRSRAQGTEEPSQPPRPRGPNREPKPNEVPKPTPPPQPDVPVIPPPGPPERGGGPRRQFRPRGGFAKGRRR